MNNNFNNNVTGNQRPSFMRGYIERVSGKDDPNVRVYGALQVRVKDCAMQTASNGKPVFSINGYGYFGKSSNIEYALGEGLLYGEKGSVTMRASAWENKATFTQEANIQPGDLIRVYGFWKRHEWTGNDGQPRASLDCTISRVEIDYRNRNNQNGDAGQQPAQSGYTARPAQNNGYAQPAPQPAPNAYAQPAQNGFGGQQGGSFIPYGDEELPFA